MALKYLDLTGLQTFWNEAKVYIDNADTTLGEKLYGTTIPASDALTLTSLKSLIDNISGGELTIPAATGAKIGGVKSGGDITVGGDGAVTVNQAAKLKTAHTISLTGGATGSTTFDGSATASIEVTVDPAQHQHTIAQVTDLQTTLDDKAPLASPALTGIPTAPTAGAGTNTTQIATTAFVKAAIDASVGDSDHIAIKGTVNSSTPLPEDNYKLGDAYIVGEAGTYAGEACEAGDWIIAIKDYAAPGADSDWSKIQKNITSAVTFTGTPTAGQVVKFNASTGIVENASFTEAAVSEAIAKAGSAVQSASVTITGSTPTADVSGGKLTINIPAYALASAVTALNDEVDANTAKLADVSTTVGALIDSKISAGIADGAVIDNRIDAVVSSAITEAIEPGKTIANWADGRYPSVAITDEEIESIFNPRPEG